MTNIDELRRYIRFQLSELSSRNEEHEFEDLCLYLARIIIHPLFLPATGPISGKGDQGRDFESFRTYLANSLKSGFVSIVSTGPAKFLVGACSLQKSYKPKIKSDVSAILSTGTRVETIYFFSGESIPVATRHEIQEEIKNTHDIHLEILDAEAISLHLTEDNAFWIAQRYLGVPAEMFPEPPRPDAWYIELKKEWQEKKLDIESYADFTSIKNGLRHAEYHSKADITYWNDRMRIFFQSSSLDLKRMAIYEAIFGTMKSNQPCVNFENDMRFYYSFSSELHAIKDFEDAGVLLNLISGEIQRENVKITYKEMSGWGLSLIKRLEKSIDDAKTPGRKCDLLSIRAFESLSIHYKIDKALHEYSTKDLDKIIHSCIDDFYKRIEAILELIPESPLFPLELILDRISEYSRRVLPQLVNHPSHDKVIRRMEDYLAQRVGGFAVASRCRDRALDYYQSGDILRAIDELHQARIKWTSAETLEGAILSMMLISEWYFELGLMFAAKFYALSAAFIVENNDNLVLKEKIPQSLMHAADLDYSSGYWMQFLVLMIYAVHMHLYYSHEPDNWEKHQEIVRLVYFISLVNYFSSRFIPELSPTVVDIAKKLKIDDIFDQTAPKVKKNFDSLDAEKLWKRIQDDLDWRPFSDVGETRIAAWKELGITWQIFWKNDYETTALAEQFISLLQIILTGFSKIDMCFLRSQIEIKLEIGSGNKYKIEPMPSNQKNMWNVKLVSIQEFNISNSKDLLINILTIIVKILYEASVLPNKTFYENLDKVLEKEFHLGVFLGNSYQELYHHYYVKELFDFTSSSKYQRPFSEYDFILEEHKAIGWFSGDGPTYKTDDVVKMLKKRYRYTQFALSTILPSLMKDNNFQDVYTQFRANGWLDWQIMATLMSIGIQFKAEQKIDHSRPPYEIAETLHQESEKILCQIEEGREVDLKLPREKIVYQYIEQGLLSTMIASLRVFGLENHWQTPNFPAIKDFLKVRYHYFEDDLPHEDPLFVPKKRDIKSSRSDKERYHDIRKRLAKR